MAVDGLDFDEALKEAQQNGYAERNPEADIEGYDACRKIAILSSLAYGAHVDYRDIYTEGITKITATDIKYAQSLGASIKLLATSKKVHDGFYAMVSPVMINAHNPLYSVQGVFSTPFLSMAMCWAMPCSTEAGRGKLPTASAGCGRRGGLRESICTSTSS
jgi:homoserine dehydrogenase